MISIRRFHSYELPIFQNHKPDSWVSNYYQDFFIVLKNFKWIQKISIFEKEIERVRVKHSNIKIESIYGHFCFIEITHCNILYESRKIFF